MIDGVGLTFCFRNFCIDLGISVSLWGLGVVTEFNEDNFQVSIFVLPVRVIFSNKPPDLTPEELDEVPK